MFTSGEKSGLVIETGFILRHHPDIVRAPDVASVAGGRRGTAETPAGFLEWAELIGMNPNSISNYARTGELPTHLALIAVLVVVISEMGGDCRRIMSRVERVRKQPRGSARGGRFGGGLAMIRLCGAPHNRIKPNGRPSTIGWFRALASAVANAGATFGDSVDRMRTVPREGVINFPLV